MTALPFDMVGPAMPDSPVILSVPHAGREYPPSLHAALAVPPGVLATLEDRYVDAVAHAARTNQTMLVQRLARAWIDLNRGEDERDPRVDEGAPPLRRDDEPIKLRSGLGVIPRRAGTVAQFWRRRFTDAAVTARIIEAHRPYHQRLSELLAAARDRWGVAVLLDVHSMPPLGPGQARAIIGDRFGQTAGARLVAGAEAEAARLGIGVALNVPYAGGHIIQRHGAPAAGIHAIQLEIDRGLYLDDRLDRPGPGLVTAATLVRRIASALADEAIGPLRQAAE